MNRSVLVVLLVLGLAGGGVVMLLSAGGENSTDLGPIPPLGAADSKSWTDKVAAGNSAGAHDGHGHGDEADDNKPRPKASASGPHPKVEAIETSYNFGRQLLHSEPGTHEFTIRNVGEADLELQAGSATCQCTTFRVDKERIAPGEETVVFIQWKAERRDTSFRHGGPVYTNDPEMPEINFSVSGAIDVAVEVQPSGNWDVGNVYMDRPGKVQTVIGSKMLEEFQIESINAGTELVNFDVRPMTAAELERDGFLSGYAIDVTVSKDVPGGKFNDEVRIAVSCSEEQLVIPLSARKHGRIRTLPTTGTFYDPEPMLLKLGVFSSTESRSGKILLIVDQAGMEESLEITEVEANPSFLTARLEPDGEQSGDKRRYFLTIEVPAGKPRVKYGVGDPASIRLHTNHPEGEVISIDVLFSTN